MSSPTPSSRVQSLNITEWNFHPKAVSKGAKIAVCLRLLLDRESPLFYQQCNARDVKTSKLIGHRMTITALSVSMSQVHGRVGYIVRFWQPQWKSTLEAEPSLKMKNDRPTWFQRVNLGAKLVLLTSNNLFSVEMWEALLDCSRRVSDPLTPAGGFFSVLSLFRT